MPASLIVSALVAGGYIAAGGLAAAAITFGIRLVTTMVISSIIAKRQMADIRDQAQAQLGNRIQLPPSTDNKIGVVYGEAYMKPIIVDAKISTDNKTMWYVMVFSEAMDNDTIGTFSFGDIYWGDKKLTFDGTDQTKVVGWTDSSGQTDNKVDGKLYMYLYRDGSATPINTNLKAWEVLSDADILEANRWDTTKRMTKLVFAICKIKYDQDAGITGLAEISAVVQNSLNKPGSVIKDYLTNSRYGAGLPLARVNTTSLTALDTYADETISYTPAGGGAAQTMPRYTINGPIDTTKNFLDNLIQLTDACDSWLSFNEKENNWSVVINRSVYDLDPLGQGIQVVNSSNIIGGVNLHPMDLNQTYNRVEIQFPNTRQRDQPGYYVLDIESFPNVTRSLNEPDNKLSIALPYTNNIVQAQYIAGRRLLQSREDLSVTFTMDHSGIQVDAGDVIAITHERYGWTNKLFRVNQVQESKSEDGSLFAQITASEYNDGVYDDNNLDLQDFTLDLNTGISDPSYMPVPYVPYVSNTYDNSNSPTFDVNNAIPAGGVVAAVEFWYGNQAALLDNNYILWTVALPSNGNVWLEGDVASITVGGLPTGNYYWRTRLVGLRSKSQFSAASNLFLWVPNPIGTIVGQNFEAHFVPTTLSVRKDSSGTVYFNSVTPKLYGQSGGGIISFSTAQADNQMPINSWRIGTSTTNYTSIALTNVTISKVPSSAVVSVSNSATYAYFASPTAFGPGGTASMFVPIRYKNNQGQVYDAIPATQQFQVVQDGTNGYNGSGGTNGLDGKDGFANFVYVPLPNVEPAQATNQQLTAAWLAATLRDPVFNDNGTFYGPTQRKNFSYYGTSTQWVAASVFIDGDLVSTGTIRGSALVANAIYGKSYQSNNATLDDTLSAGTWINGQNGNARFAGNVSIGNNATIGNNLSIGNNLTVAGLITTGALDADTVSANNIVIKTITRDKLAEGTIPSELGNSSVPNAITGGGSTWDGYDSTDPAHYTVLGYYRLTVPDQYFSGGTNPQIKVSYNASITATRTSGGSNLRLYAYLKGNSANTDLVSTDVHSLGLPSSAYLISGAGNPRTYNQVWTYSYNFSFPASWTTQGSDNNFIVMVMRTDTTPAYLPGPTWAITNQNFVVSWA